MGGSLSLLDVLGEDFIVVSSESLRLLKALNLSLLLELLSSESLLSHQSLDLGALVECLVTLLYLTADNVLSNIVLLAESEDLADVAGSLGTKAARLIVVGNTVNISVTLLDDLEGNNGQIGTADATTNGLSLSLTSSSGSVCCGLYIIN